MRIIRRICNWKAKQVYKFFKAFSTLEIELVKINDLSSSIIGMNRKSFYSVFNYTPIAEALQFKTTMRTIEDLVYLYNKGKEVQITITSLSGIQGVFNITKKRKSANYYDIRCLAHLLCYYIITTSTKRWERKFVKQACTAYLKDRKEIDKYENICL